MALVASSSITSPLPPRAREAYAPPLVSVEVWSDYVAAGGNRVAVVPPNAIVSLSTTEKLDASDTGTLVLASIDSITAEIVPWRVLQLVTQSGTVSEWRIIEVSRELSSVTASLRGPLLDLDATAAITQPVAGRAEAAFSLAGQPLQTALNIALSVAPSYYQVGTIDASFAGAYVDIAANGWTALKALRGIMQSLKAQGITAELGLRRATNGTFYIDLVPALGAGAETLDARLGKNITQVTERLSAERYARSVVVLGTASNPPGIIGDAYFRITAKAGNVLTVAWPSDTGGSVNLLTDQVTGWRLIAQDGSTQLITASGGNQITVSNSTAFGVGHLVRLVTDTAGTRPMILPLANGTVERPTRTASINLTGYTNFVRNPYLARWTGGTPDDWSVSGSIVQDTSDWLTGGASAHASGGFVTLSQSSLATRATGPNGSRWQCSVWLKPPAYQLVFAGVTVDLTTLPSAEWSRIDVAGPSVGPDFAPGPSISLQPNGKLDSAQVTYSPQPLQRIAGSDGARLFMLAQEYLAKYSAGPTSGFEAAVADLASIDPSSYVERLTIGQNVRITIFDRVYLGRVRQIVRNWLAPEKVRVAVDYVARDISALLAGLEV